MHGVPVNDTAVAFTIFSTVCPLCQQIKWEWAENRCVSTGSFYGAVIQSASSSQHIMSLYKIGDLGRNLQILAYRNLFWSE